MIDPGDGKLVPRLPGKAASVSGQKRRQEAARIRVEYLGEPRAQALRKPRGPEARPHMRRRSDLRRRTRAQKKPDALRPGIEVFIRRNAPRRKLELHAAAYPVAGPQLRLLLAQIEGAAQPPPVQTKLHRSGRAVFARLRLFQHQRVDLHFRAVIPRRAAKRQSAVAGAPRKPHRNAQQADPERAQPAFPPQRRKQGYARRENGCGQHRQRGGHRQNRKGRRSGKSGRKNQQPAHYFFSPKPSR